MSSSTPRIDETTSLDDLAHIVCATLTDNGIDAVLSGGAVVSLYTDNRYLSYDLDFITTAPIDNIALILETVGFTRESGRHFSHRKCPFEIEFPGSVVMIGRTRITDYREDTNALGTLRLLTPTHAAMDRLAAFYHWGDRAGLDQAVMIGACQPVDMQAVEEWSRAEGSAQQYAVFSAALRKARRGGTAHDHNG